MNILTIIIIAFISNLDNIPISIINNITKKESITISFISTIIIIFLTLLFLLFCQNINIINLERISSLLLILIGLKSFFKRNTHQRYITICAIILNNISLAIATCTNITNIIIFSISNFISSIIFFNISKIIKPNEKYEMIIEKVSAFLLILIGVIKIIK